MYAARYRSACALPLNLICGFETTYRKMQRLLRKLIIGF
jgi:hypothetical protein